MNDQRITRLAGLLHGLTIAALIVIPIFAVGFLVLLSAGFLTTILPDEILATGVFLWAGIAVGFIPVLALLWVLNALRQLFERYRDGDVLTQPSAALILKAGKGLIWLAGLNIAVQPVTSVLLSWQAPPGQRALSVGIGQAEIGFVFAAGLLTLIGWALTEAARQADENKGFV